MSNEEIVKVLIELLDKNYSRTIEVLSQIIYELIKKLNE